eukprot:3558148-Rhodomonas_salina.1
MRLWRTLVFDFGVQSAAEIRAMGRHASSVVALQLWLFSRDSQSHDSSAATASGSSPSLSQAI